MTPTQPPPCRPLEALHDLLARLSEFVASHPARTNPRAWTTNGRLGVAAYHIRAALHWLGDDAIDPETFAFRPDTIAPDGAP